jgi:glutamate decarboxylase
MSKRQNTGDPNGKGKLTHTSSASFSSDKTDEPVERLVAASYSYYASPSARTQYGLALPEYPAPASHVKQLIADVHELDFNTRLNTSSYVNVTFEPEEQDVLVLGAAVNLADQTVYPASFKMHNDVINMIASLWHCPKPPDFDEYGCYAGAGTVGSTEACLLAGLALKFRWREWYAKRTGKSAEEVRGTMPNMVITTQFQAAWEKFFKVRLPKLVCDPCAAWAQLM